MPSASLIYKNLIKTYKNFTFLDLEKLLENKKRPEDMNFFLDFQQSTIFIYEVPPGVYVSSEINITLQTSLFTIIGNNKDMNLRLKFNTVLLFDERSFFKNY